MRTVKCQQHFLRVWDRSAFESRDSKEAVFILRREAEGLFWERGAINMSPSYNQRSLVVLSLLGVLSAVMSVLSVMLIFQLQPQQAAAVKESPPSTSAVIPAAVWAVLLPVAAVLAALSLTLHLSSAVVCLLHSYFSTELCRGEQDTDRYLRRSPFTTRHRKEPDGAVHPQFRKKTAATGSPCLGHVRGARASGAPVGPDTVLQITVTGLI